MNASNTAEVSNSTSESDLQPSKNFDAQGLTLPKDNQTTRQAVLAALNEYLQQHWNGSGAFKPFQPSDVQSGPASQSDYAGPIRQAYGEDAVRYSWWIAAGQPGIPFETFSKEHPALVINYYLVNRDGRWSVWYIH
jgi:hypothetical protein